MKNNMQLFIKLEDGKPTGFPVLEGNIRFIFPSLPDRYLHAGDLIGTGFGVLQPTTPPVLPNPTYKISQVPPTRRNEKLEWLQQWEVSEREDLTEEEKTKLLLQFEQDMNFLFSVRYREYRNTLLTNSDWTQVADAPVDQPAWAIYRQALRDITDHPNWPNLQEADWPTKP
jgi:hypothetical protein